MSIAFTETEALLIALRGDEDELERYLIENFLPGELRELSRASGMLRAACNDVAEEVARKHGP